MANEGEPHPGAPGKLKAERIAELRAAYEANIAFGRPPYVDVEIQSTEEFLWILQERNWSGWGDSAERANFSGARFSRWVYLHNARLVGANLAGADLRIAQLRGANLWGANLSHANLAEAVLSNSTLYEADLTCANLQRADMRGADMLSATLVGANLKFIWVDAGTIFADVKLDASTEVGGVAWNNVQLTQVDWSQIPTLGDELAIATSKNRRDRIAKYRDVAQAYHGLAVALRVQGMLETASLFRLREQRFLRKALLLEFHLPSWIGSLLLDWVAGYGERPARAFRTYAITVSMFAAGYYVLTNWSQARPDVRDARLRWYEALVLSLSAFHGRGFFPQSLSLGDPVAVLAAIEAVIGLFIELIFIATFSRRFFGN